MFYTFYKSDTKLHGHGWLGLAMTLWPCQGFELQILCSHVYAECIEKSVRIKEFKKKTQRWRQHEWNTAVTKIYEQQLRTMSGNALGKGELVLALSL